MGINVMAQALNQKSQLRFSFVLWRRLGGFQPAHHPLEPRAFLWISETRPSLTRKTPSAATKIPIRSFSPHFLALSANYALSVIRPDHLKSAKSRDLPASPPLLKLETSPDKTTNSVACTVTTLILHRRAFSATQITLDIDFSVRVALAVLICGILC